MRTRSCWLPVGWDGFAKDLELQALMKDIATLEEGVQEYQDRLTCLRRKSWTFKRAWSGMKNGAAGSGC